MHARSITKPFLAIVFIVLIVIANASMRPDPSDANAGRTLALQAPVFLAIANAEEAPTAFPVDEAGIAAYFNANQPITLANVRDVFRTIEVETPDYIIGSVAVPGYPESEDVHVYIHRTGWLMAYYLAADPVAKIFDWRVYNGSAIGTKIEKILTIVASEAGVPFPGATFYDFRYPNANRLMLIGETYQDGNDFTVWLPGSFVFYERSWGLLNFGYDSYWRLNGTTVGNACGNCTNQGFLTSAQLLPGTTYTVQVDDHGGLALVYRVP